MTDPVAIAIVGAVASVINGVFVFLGTRNVKKNQRILRKESAEEHDRAVNKLDENARKLDELHARLPGNGKVDG